MGAAGSIADRKRGQARRGWALVSRWCESPPRIANLRAGSLCQPVSARSLATMPAGAGVCDVRAFSIRTFGACVPQGVAKHCALPLSQHVVEPIGDAAARLIPPDLPSAKAGRCGATDRRGAVVARCYASDVGGVKGAPSDSFSTICAANSRSSDDRRSSSSEESEKAERIAASAVS